MQNVAELVAYLLTLDQTAGITGIAAIESGRSSSTSDNCGVGVQYYEEYTYEPDPDCDGFDEDDVDEDGVVTVKNVVVFTCSGEETSCQ